MDNGKDRVFMLIVTEHGVQWTIITSRDASDEFISQWRTKDCMDLMNLIEISGVLDHRDANEIRFVFLKGCIDCVEILEIKV